MSQAIAIEKLTLHALEQNSNLARTKNADFFSEWQDSLPELTSFEMARLEHIRVLELSTKTLRVGWL